MTAETAPEGPEVTFPDHREAFRLDLAKLLNRYSMENGSDTPDFILADYLLGCLGNFNVAVERRTRWYKPEAQS